MVVDQAQEFTEYLWQGIPICQEMGVKAIPMGPNQFCLQAPLDPNRNVHASAFAGSIYTVASMTGWGLIRQYLDKRLHASGGCYKVADLWLSRANIRYHQPIRDDFCAIVEAEEGRLDQLWHKLVRKGCAKMKLTGFIGPQDKPLASIDAEYAARLFLASEK